jgi:hypothetical protein
VSGGYKRRRFNRHQRRIIWITAGLALPMFLYGHERLAFVLIALGTLLVGLLSDFA